MRLQFYLNLFLALSVSTGFPQKITTQIAVPDSLKKMCDKLFISEIGKTQFFTCIKFKKSSGTKSIFADNKERKDFKLDYTFCYPSVVEACVDLTFIYSVYSGKGQLQSGSFLRINKSDLPAGTNTNGIKVINYKTAETIALNTDSILKKNMNKVEGKFVLYYDAFYWHFSFSYPDPNPKSESDEKYIQHIVVINPFSGKVKSAYIQ